MASGGVKKLNVLKGTGAKASESGSFVTSAATSAAELSALQLSELKGLRKQRALPTGGTKSDIIERLLAPPPGSMECEELKGFAFEGFPPAADHPASPGP